MTARNTALLALEDGTVFRGRQFGADSQTSGEVVFHTGLTGYQEILTDPSYRGQIVVMTYPHIGNTGINPEDDETKLPFLSGFAVKDPSIVTSNWRSRESLDAFMKRTGIAGISGIDTRMLTRHVRDKGAQRGVISAIPAGADLKKEGDKLVKAANAAPTLTGRDLVAEVTCATAYDWREGVWSLGAGFDKPSAGKRKFVVAYDFGVKRNILRMLVSAGCDVKVVPASTPADDIIAMKPDGLFLSNGPGDPEAVPYAAEQTMKIAKTGLPVFGICLGHQIISLAFGAKTYKLKFGHHGANHPVMDLATGKVEITSQNHGFAVDSSNLPAHLEVTHLNLNDKTVEGMRHKNLPVFCVQYHPEASPGPHDSAYLFGRFMDLMGKN